MNCFRIAAALAVAAFLAACATPEPAPTQVAKADKKDCTPVLGTNICRKANDGAMAVETISGDALRRNGVGGEIMGPQGERVK